MGIHLTYIGNIDSSIAVYVSAGKFIPGQFRCLFHMGIGFTNIGNIQFPVSVDVPPEVDLHILGHGFRTYRDGVLTGDMLALDDLVYSRVTCLLLMTLMVYVPERTSENE